MREKGAVVISNATELKQHFDQLVRHDYLQQYIDDTRPDQDELWLAHQLIRDVEQQERTLAISLAWGFVHAGVMIHDLVSLHNNENDTLKKRRQLNVLAGDFYSARYYQSLARVNAVDMVELFGSTLQDIYELKMTHYMDKSLTEDELLHRKTAIDALLLLRILGKEEEESFVERLHLYFLSKKITRLLKSEASVDDTTRLRQKQQTCEEKLKQSINFKRNDTLDQFLTDFFRLTEEGR
ncbi:heptaprenyl diphosphate synthase component 1 [Shouchella sp. 1P09AA]|uniref:heptaprenyl diphosphate synthase component 1 n=1 Tax=unclassified Shouchella TaxID=2893065 RepID=UPI0039A31C27